MNFQALKSVYVRNASATVPTFTSLGRQTINNVSNQVYDLIVIDGTGLGNGTLFDISNSTNITIKRLKIINASRLSMRIYRCSNVTIDTIYFEENAGAIYVHESQNIRIKNILAAKVSRLTGDSRGQLVQLNNCRYCVVEDCYGFNPSGYEQEDWYNNYNGQFNVFRRCYARATDTCTTSGTLVIIDGSARVADVDKGTGLDDDYWGKITGFYNMANDNLIEDCIGVNCANVGGAIAAGRRNIMRNSKFFHDGTLVGSTTSGCGWYLSDQAGFGDFNGNTIQNMQAYWNNGTSFNHSFFDTTPPNNDANAILINNTVNSALNVNLLPSGADMVNLERFNRMCLGIAA